MDQEDKNLVVWGDQWGTRGFCELLLFLCSVRTVSVPPQVRGLVGWPAGACCLIWSAVHPQHLVGGQARHLCSTTHNRICRILNTNVVRSVADPWGFGTDSWTVLLLNISSKIGNLKNKWVWKYPSPFTKKIIPSKLGLTLQLICYFKSSCRDCIYSPVQ